MQFLTVDMEVADRILPSICSFTIVRWIDGTPCNWFHTMLNPECDVEDFFADRHGFTNDDLKNSPVLREKWRRIYDILEGSMVFAHYANRTFQMLQRRAEIDYLNMPNFTFADSASIARRCFPGLGDYRLPNVSEKLEITTNHNDSYTDAHTVAAIIMKALEKEEVSSCDELFKKVGFVGGKYENQKKILVRPKRDVINGIYVPQYYEAKKRGPRKE